MTAAMAGDESSVVGAKPKRFKSWFKLPRRPFRSKTNLTEGIVVTAATAADDEEKPVRRDSIAAGDQEQQQVANQNDAVYYNFGPVSRPATEDQHLEAGEEAEEGANNDDDVFSDTSTLPPGGAGSVRTLSRRRHSLGSWFRSSLAAVRKTNATSSTGSGLETPDVTRHTERPSTSSERVLLSRNVSTSANCVSST